MAMVDGFVVGWYQKRHFAFWRPVTAIRKGDTDANARTAPDPSWMSLRPTPALPDYPSTHSLLGGAAAEVLREFTGTNYLSLCMASTTSTPAGTPAVLEFVHAGRTGERRVARAASDSTSDSRSRPASRSGARSVASRCAMRCDSCGSHASAAPLLRPERRPTDFTGATGTARDPASDDEEPERAPGRQTPRPGPRFTRMIGAEGPEQRGQRHGCRRRPCLAGRGRATPARSRHGAFAGCAPGRLPPIVIKRWRLKSVLDLGVHSVVRALSQIQETRSRHHPGPGGASWSVIAERRRRCAQITPRSASRSPARQTCAIVDKRHSAGVGVAPPFAAHMSITRWCDRLSRGGALIWSRCQRRRVRWRLRQRMASLVLLPSARWRAM